MVGQQPSGWDPYHAWLNTTELHRPLNVYQLLSLAPHEVDEDIIQAAAEEKRAALLSHRDTADPHIWLKVHNELEQAISVLLDPAKKETLDRKLLNHHPDRPGTPPIPEIGAANDPGSLPCGNCGAPNPATRRFCTHCGTNLWEPCFQCGTLIRSGEPYCGACGVNLNEGLQQQARKFQKEIQEVTQLREMHQFDEAVRRLKTIAGNDNPRLSEWREKATRLMQETLAQEVSQRNEVQLALETSRQLFENHEYHESLQVLDRIPEPLQTDEVRSWAAEVERRKEQIGNLKSRLREAVRAGHASEVAILLEELISLQPDDPQWNRLSQQLQQRYCKAARRSLARHNYQEALQTLKHLPKAGRTEEVEKLCEAATELAALAWDLEHAPVIDQTLLAVGDRLRKLVPCDQQTAERVALLHRKAKQAADQPSFEPVQWVPPPKKTPLGFPVQWITGFRRISLDAGVDPSVLREHPGQFAVACGLALQGIDLARVGGNLYPTDRRKFLAKATRLLTGRPARHAWGLDLSSSGVKAVKLVLGRDRACSIADCYHVPHRKALSQAANEEERATLIEETLARLQSHTDLRADRLCVNLSGHSVIVRHVQLPPMERAKVSKAMQYEVQHQLPLPPSALCWDYQLLGESEDDRKSKRERKAVVTAVTRAIADTQLERLEKAGLDVNLVQADCVALHNFCAYEGYTTQEREERAGEEKPLVTIILDVGNDSSNVVLSGQDTLWYRNIGIGGHHFTRALTRELRLTLAQAEQLKRRLAAARRFGEAWEPLGVVCEDLLGEIRTSLDRFAKSHGEPEVRGLLGLGGGFRLHGLWRWLCTGR